MELKKSFKADLQNKRTLFLEIGLCVSLLLMIVVFSVSSGEKKLDDIASEEVFIMSEMMEVTVQEEVTSGPPQPREAISILADVINIVDNDTQITEDLVFTDFDETAAFVRNVTSTVESGRGLGSSNDPFMKVEVMPKFQGGDINTFSRWVVSRVRYPQMARQMGITGIVTLQFVIERDGTLSSVEVLSNPHNLLTDEAVRVVKSSPKWTPGRQSNMPVRVSFVLPVEFELK